ncbi:MAG: amidohydrolase [Bacteroidetes bacterium]|nr:amidohydrolase [Bacteroidota bacterium]MBL6944972.1 amidohydrolase [Bacteroidales bacterium]
MTTLLSKIKITLYLVIMATTLIAQKANVDLIITNARIYTVNESFDINEALAVDKGKFVAVGSTDAVLSSFKSDNIVNGQGKFIYPGFNDGHNHFLGYGLMETKYANLVGTASFDEVIDRLADHAKNFPGEWILGRGWDQNDWENISFPTKDKLDKVFPNNPVVLTRIDGHAVIANTQALNRAGIDIVSSVDGGEVIVENGEPTGVLVDNAIALVRDIIPEFSREEKIQALLIAQQLCFAVGLTSVTDAGLDKDEIVLIDELQQSGELNIRVYAMLNPTKENFDFFFEKGTINNGKLTVSSVKLYVDGALGSRGALLLEPYSDAPHTLGLQIKPQAYYDSVCKLAFKAGFQVNTHAIGDSGNRIMLLSYAKCLKGKNDRRWRIEHAQVVHPNDLKLFSDYSIIPSIQSTHCTSDMSWADERLGHERIKNAYASHDLLLQNGWVINGTDSPIEDICPLKTYYAAISRKDLNGWPDNGFQKENALNRQDALRSITIWPAKGSFDENIKGSIEVGKVADFVILDQDIMQIPELKIPKTVVIATYIDGNVLTGK